MSKTESPRIDLRTIKHAVSMERVLVHYGILDRFSRGQDSWTGPCPIHNGTNPTQFRVSVSKNVWNCFSDCKCGGSVIDFVGQMEKVGTMQAARLLVDWFSLEATMIERGSSAETLIREDITVTAKSKLKPKFQLGRICITNNLRRQVALADALHGLCQHWHGDWGKVDAEDVKSNNRALADGSRLLSEYKSREGVTYWIITEADRSFTTILLPGDY